MRGAGDGIALSNDFTKAVQDAYDQAITARRALLDGGYRLIDANGATITLPDNVDEAYILCVTGDDYPAVMTQARIYLNVKDRDPHPIILSIFDLDVVSFYLNDRHEFLYYIRQRSAHTMHFVADSEVSLLGFHLRHKLFPDQNYDEMVLDNSFSQLVDADFLASRGNWHKSDSSERLFHTWRNKAFDELVEDIKQAANEGSRQISAEDLLFFMYDLAGKGADDLINLVEQLKRQTLQDGQEHSARMPMSRHKSGVTFVSYPAPTHSTQLFALERKLEAISFAHKYMSRADEWMMLASFAGSPVRFDIFGYIKGPWQQDTEMDQFVQEPLARGIPIRPDGKRFSRNETCPCGSGKKFKRCHGQ